MNLTKLLRLINFDDSREFKIIVSMKEEEQSDNHIQVSKETRITINTTINKARVISKKIDELYHVDQGIGQYEIELNNIQESNKARKVVEVFNILLKSIGQEVNIPEELAVIFLIIQNNLGEDIEANNNNNNAEHNENNNNKDGNDGLGYSDLLFMYKIYK